MTFPRGRWSGQWIWGARGAINPWDGRAVEPTLDPMRFDQWVLFRRSFELDEVPAEAPFRITADSRYILWINGEEIARGPVRHGPRRLRYDIGDAAPLLRPGTNAVAVLARFYGHRTPWWEPAPPTFSLGGGALVAEMRLGGDNWLVTNGEWRCHEAVAWTPADKPTDPIRGRLAEVLDARLLDPTWKDWDYDDSSWEPAQVLLATSFGAMPDARPPSEPYGALLPRPLPPLGGAVQAPTLVQLAPVRRELEPIGDGVPPQEVVRAALAGATRGGHVELPTETKLDGGPQLLTIDFGKIVSGHLRMEFDAPGGVQIFGVMAEAFTTDPPTLASPAGFLYTTRGRADVFELFDSVGGRYALLCLQGTGTARVLDIAVQERLRPRPEGPYFECSDPLLTRVYQVGVRTVDLTAHDAYVDCPTREQRAWAGDAVVHQSVDLVVNPDWSLARWHPQLAWQPRSDGLIPMVAAGDFASPTLPTIPDWALHWIRSIHNLFRYTGDREQVEGLLPGAECVLRWFDDFRGDDGLIHDVTGWVLIDWSPVQVRGTSAALNALWARALRDVAEMARWLGDSGRASWCDHRHDGVRRGFEVFWDADRGGYRDHAVGDVVLPAMSEHSTAAAVCAGLVPAERQDVVRSFLLDRDRMFQRVASQITAEPGRDSDLLDQLFVVGEPDWDVDKRVVAAQPFFRYVVHDALAALGAAGSIAGLCRDWEGLLAIGPTAWRETWEGGSWCHGWSSTPTRDLVIYTLGITPGEPGYMRVRIAPRLGNLEWARGAVPTPHGLVHVDVHRSELTVDSPVPVDVLHSNGDITSHDAGHSMVELSS